MAFSLKEWKNGPSGATPTNAVGWNDQETRIKTAFEKIDKNTDWSSGERVFALTGQEPAPPQKLELNLGSTAEPNTVYGPGAAFSRVHSIKETEIKGDGEAGLAALRASTVAVESSQVPAIGAAFGARTYSSYESGVNALADALALTSVGISSAGSTRTGQGGFFNGRTESNVGRATGIELVVDNESEVEDEYTSAFPRTKGMHLHGIGLKRSAVGLLISNVGIGFHTGLAAMKEASISSAFIRDDSSAPYSLRVKGEHSKAAISIGEKAGPLLIGLEERANEKALFELFGGAESRDPIAVFRISGNNSIRTQMAANGPGVLAAFAAGGSNAFLTGTVLGDSGLSYAAGHIFHIGAQGKSSQFRMAESGIGFFGTAPQSKPTGVAKTAEGVWTALNTLGLIE